VPNDGDDEEEEEDEDDDKTGSKQCNQI